MVGKEQMDKLNKVLFKEFGKNAWGEELYIVEYKNNKNVLSQSEIEKWCKEVDDTENWHGS